MRSSRLSLMLVLMLPLIAKAADAPPQLEPLPDVPPPPNSSIDGEISSEPQITIIKRFRYHRRVSFKQ